MALKIWKKLSGKTLFKNDYWSYLLDEFEIEGSGKGKYHYVHTIGSTMIIPVTNDNKIILVNQYRYLNQKESIEFPCGSVEEGLLFEDNAIKELREETGFSSMKLIKAGEFSPYNGVSDEMCVVYVAKNLFSDPLEGDFTEDFELKFASPSEIDIMIDNNIIWDGMSIAAWTLAKKYFK
jgi:ADP-ribose pyrophosphatase